ncbi:MAG: nucleotide exchange factor GrpE [Planctomycetota bacterium]|jgi:molecular chaperone GrpE (heat shock protein)
MRIEEQRSQVKKDSKVLRDSGWQGLEVNSADQAEKIGVLLSDEKSIELEESLKAATENVNVSLKLKDSLKAQTESLEKQMAEFRQMAQSVRQAAVEQSEPINGTLTELTQQVAAIREYAASQQSRVEKLQDGYDWNIIKTFCLRVIRCIDNLEGRISRLTEQDVGAAHLEEIKDELIFALESSGVEQFKPEINSDYRGQEKYAEAIKGKESCDDPKRKGKIAKVIRPGYQYSISEDNVKVVRPAQVRLFG